MRAISFESHAEVQTFSAPSGRRQLLSSWQLPSSQHPRCSHSRRPCALIDCSRQLDCPAHRSPAPPPQRPHGDDCIWLVGGGAGCALSGQSGCLEQRISAHGRLERVLKGCTWYLLSGTASNASIAGLADSYRGFFNPPPVRFLLPAGSRAAACGRGGRVLR